MIINVKDYGLDFNTSNFGVKLLNIIKKLPKDECNELIFEKGEYILNIDEAITEIVYMTNTVSEAEMFEPKKKIGVKLENLSNLILNGNGAKLSYEGRMTEFYLNNCRNIVIKNFIIDNRKPSVAEFDVITKNLFSIEIKPTINSAFKILNNKLKWDCELPDNKYVIQECKNGVTRRMDLISWGANPFSKHKAKSLNNHNIKIFWPFNIFKAGYRYQIRNEKRDGAGFFINRCENITLDNLQVHFMHGMGVLCQVSKNISVTNCKFTPNKEVDRTTTAFADMFHASMCSGLIKIINNEFDGAHDDVVNVHGNHFVMKKIDSRTILVKWMHPQAYGFNPFDDGDEIEFINRSSLAVIETNKVLYSKMVNPRVIQLELEKDVEANDDSAVEIANKTPDVLIENNTIKNIPTRGILCTTRGKVRINNNKFYKTHMAGVLISDDAMSWYESGYVRDVEITNNLFDECQGYVIDIYPEAHSIKEAPIVHKNIMITNNKFILNQPNVIRVKRSSNVIFKDNEIEGVAPKSMEIDCKNVQIDF